MKNDAIRHFLDLLMTRKLSPFDLLPHTDLREKLVELVLFGELNGGDAETANQFLHLRSALESQVVKDVKVVVFGGGTGLSNLIGGDSRSPQWPRKPFVGLKEIFPHTRAIVCVTDDGGSTGELQKDLPLIALGDLRHVLLSSIQSERLQSLYGIARPQAKKVVSQLAKIFNYRFQRRPESSSSLLAQAGVDHTILPAPLGQTLIAYIDLLFTDTRLIPTLDRPHCLGNLIVAAAIYAEIPPIITHNDCISNHTVLSASTVRGLAALSAIMGAAEQAVLPCTTSQARLSVLYSNGVLVLGEKKSSYARRGYPIERIFKEFCEKPLVPSEVLERIAEADILIMAPGSLYSSLIPVFQVPGLTQAVRANTRAMKILVSNLWVQAGETDQSIGDIERKFLVSDLLKAYDRNIPGGIKGLFEQVLCLSLKDVSASVLQNYAVEGKNPIYLDREQVCAQGFIPIECGIFSRAALAKQGVIQHGPIHLAKVIKTLWTISGMVKDGCKGSHSSPQEKGISANTGGEASWVERTWVERPLSRYQQIHQKVHALPIFIESQGAKGPGGVIRETGVRAERIRQMMENILWRHQDIPLAHLGWLRGVASIERNQWLRNQTWDSVFSFYDPEDGLIKIRADQVQDEQSFEVAFLVALGQSLLGNYVHSKEMRPLLIDAIALGKVYHLHLRPEGQRSCYFNSSELCHFLQLTRLLPVNGDATHFTRVINGDEGFTPPGMLMGLHYAWYLDNRFACHIEYKMAVMKITPALLVPEQIKMLGRRQNMVSFFREVVFRQREYPEE